MMGGWYPRHRSILQELERGSLSLLDIAIHDVLSQWADYRTGVCLASAEKIKALCPAEFSYKSIQRSLLKLERLGWIKRWMTRGRRGNYTVLVCRFFVRDASMTWKATNGQKTSDWRDVQFDPVHDTSFNCPPVDPRGARELDHEVAHDVSGVQEVRKQQQEDKRNGRTKRDTSPSKADGVLSGDSASGNSDPPEMVAKLGPRELKGLKTTLERTLRDRRMPAEYRETTRQKLNQVLTLLKKREPANSGSGNR